MCIRIKYAFLFCFFSLGLPVFSNEPIRENNTELLNTELLNTELLNTELLNADENGSEYFEWMYNYSVWYDALTYMAETCRAAVTPGTGICPDEPFPNWAMRNTAKLIEMMKSYDLDSEELYKKLREVDDYYNMVLVRFRENRKALDELYAKAIPLFIAILISGSLTVSGGHYLVRNNPIYQRLNRFAVWFTGAGMHITRVSASATLKAVSQCINSCGSRCVNDLLSALTQNIEPVVRSCSFEKSVKQFPELSAGITTLRLVISLPYPDWVKATRDVVLPVTLAGFHGVAQLNADRLDPTDLQLFSDFSAGIAYAGISNILNPADSLEELSYLIKGVLNIEFMKSSSLSGMAVAGSAKVIGGLLLNDCQNTLNALVLPLLTIAPAAYFQYARPGKKVPYTRLHPKYLIGAAMIAGDVLSAATNNHPEYILVPLMAFDERINGNHKTKAFIFGAALLFVPFHYYFGDDIKNLWKSMFGNYSAPNRD